MKNIENKGVILTIIVIVALLFFYNRGSKNQVSEETGCHPSYSGCLNSSASDYDCSGGSGNGPYYTGKVRVIGPDVFGLDRDGNGWGCE